MDSTPDTGCTITLLNYDLALRNGIHIDRTKKIELYHAAGGNMHVEGVANIRVCANNIQATLRVAVSSELKENMLISCDDLRTLRVIPADFPNAVLAVHQPNKLAHLKTNIGTDTTSVRDLEYPIKVPTEGAVLLTVYSRLTDIPQPVGFSI